MTGRKRGMAALLLAAGALGAGRMPAADPLTDAMDAMIQEEYRSAAYYDRLAQDVGAVQPFAGWAETERAHAELIGWLYRDRERPVPGSRWAAAALPARRTLPQACAAALAAEERTVTLYDGYLQRELPSDVKRVFRHNRNVAALQHVPALRECTLRGPAPR
ncbi:MAG TPA: hypothetical protein VEX86_20655 [Longimicrobium sp.]|nr:hypothetical protein [Longimicrobium sp.]